MNSGFVDILPLGDQGYQSDSKPLVYAFGSNKKKCQRPGGLGKNQKRRNNN